MVSVTKSNIEVEAEVDGKKFNVIELEVNRAISSAGELKLTGVAENASSIDLNSTANVLVEQQFTVDKGKAFGDQKVREVAFRGLVKKVEERYDGTVIVYAYDRLTELYNKRVKLNTEEPRTPDNIVADLLSDAGFTVKRGDVSVLKGVTDSFYIPNTETFPGNINGIKPTYGSAQAGDRLYYVLNDLAAKLGAVLWVDKNNNVRIEPYPSDFEQAEVERIIEFGQGDEDIGEKKVTVKGGSPTGELGSAAFSLYNRTTPSKSVRSGAGEEPDPPTKTLRDDNIVTQEGVERRATANRFREGLNVNVGEVTVSGEPRIELFDKIQLPDKFVNTEPLLESSRTASRLSDPSVVERFFTVQRVTHTINSQDGFRTQFALAEDAEAIINGIEGVSRKLEDEFKENTQTSEGRDSGLFSFLD